MFLHKIGHRRQRLVNSGNHIRHVFLECTPSVKLIGHISVHTEPAGLDRHNKPSFVIQYPVGERYELYRDTLLNNGFPEAAGDD